MQLLLLLFFGRGVSWWFVGGKTRGPELLVGLGRHFSFLTCNSTHGGCLSGTAIRHVSLHTRCAKLAGEIAGFWNGSPHYPWSNPKLYNFAGHIFFSWWFMRWIVVSHSIVLNLVAIREGSLSKMACFYVLHSKKKNLKTFKNII